MCVSTLKHTLYLLVEAYDAGVVLEHAHAPVVLAELLANLLRCREDRLLEHVLEPPLAIRAAIRHAAAERLVAAMLAPGLGERLQFRIGRVAAQLAEMRLNRLHLGKRQIELAFAAQLHKRRVVQLAQRHA